MEGLKTVGKIFRILLWCLIGAFFVFMALDISIRFFGFLQSPAEALAKCPQCRPGAVVLAYGLAMLSCAAAVGVSIYHPKNGFYTLVAAFWVMALAVSGDLWDFSYSANLYSFAGREGGYWAYIRTEILVLMVAMCGVLQVYLRPPLRKYVVTGSTLLLLVCGVVNNWQIIWNML